MPVSLLRAGRMPDPWNPWIGEWMEEQWNGRADKVAKLCQPKASRRSKPLVRFWRYKWRNVPSDMTIRSIF